MDSVIQPHHHHFRLALGMSAVIVVLGGVGLWIYFANKPKPAPTKTKGIVAQTLAAPQDFEDFVVAVTAVNGSDIQGSFGLTGTDNKTTNHSYTIHTDGKTILQTQSIGSKGVAVFSPMKLSDIKIGNKIHAYSNTNIYPVSEFTATKIYLIH